NRGAEAFERARLRLGPVPDRHRVAAAQQTLDHRAAQESRSEKRHLRHVNLPLESIAVRRPRLIKLSRFRVFVFSWLIVLAAHGLHADAPPTPFVWAGDPQGGAP